LPPFIGLVDQSPGAGLVALRQTFVRRYYGGLGSSRACRELGKSEDRGVVRVRSREVFRGSKSKAPPFTRGWPAVHWQIDVLSSLCRSCCFAPNICSSLPWWFGFTQACREPANQAMTAGSPRSECVRFSGAAKQSATVLTRGTPPLPPRAELLLCAKHLFVAAMVAGVHAGQPGTGKIRT
jgi:hypothetical protein